MKNKNTEKIRKNKSLRKTLVSLVLGTAMLFGGIGMNGCENKTPPKEERTVELNISDHLNFGNYANDDLFYCGMPNKDTFSLSANYYSCVNLYYPADSKNINFYGEKVEVLLVSADKILLKVHTEKGHK